MTSSDDRSTGELPPEHPAGSDDAVSAGDVLSGQAWRPDGKVHGGDVRGGDAPPSTDRQPDVPGRAPAEGGDDVPPPPPARGGDRANVADDVKQFLDVPAPESPATDADAPAPG